MPVDYALALSLLPVYDSIDGYGLDEWLVIFQVFAAPYSLRFPRIDRVRFDKPWFECLDVQSECIVDIQMFPTWFFNSNSVYNFCCFFSFLKGKLVVKNCHRWCICQIFRTYNCSFCGVSSFKQWHHTQRRRLWRCAGS